MEPGIDEPVLPPDELVPDDVELPDVELPDEELPPSPPRGAAEPLEDPVVFGRPWAQTGETLSAKAAATAPTMNF
jgi:hypothetical protein